MFCIEWVQKFYCVCYFRMLILEIQFYENGFLIESFSDRSSKSNY